MEKHTWKILALILLTIIILENLAIGWGVYLLNEEENKSNICYYDVCEGFPEAWYGEGICTCYDYDLIGNLQIVKEKYLT